jgi:hypothetical protein
MEGARQAERGELEDGEPQQGAGDVDPEEEEDDDGQHALQAQERHEPERHAQDHGGRQGGGRGLAVQHLHQLDEELERDHGADPTSTTSPEGRQAELRI